MFRHLFSTALIIPLIVANPSPSCKTSTSSISTSTWQQFNSSLSGALISTAEYGVPGGICFQGQPNYNESACSGLQKEWFTSWELESMHPVHNGYPNYNNDSCWPFPELGLECNPLLGYPTYVVNASNAGQVSTAVDFARNNNVRLIVKASGHDFRGRSVAGNSLSIWTKYLTGLELHQSFIPAGNCNYGKGETAITWGAGENAGTRAAFANSSGLYVTVGGTATIGSGYTLGGGHSLTSPAHGLSADNILEINIVTPDGKLVTANQCQNEDIFWAVRGGGGSTFGVLVNATERAFPKEPLTVYGMLIEGSSTTNTTLFYEAGAALFGQYPALGDAAISSYTFLTPGNATSPPNIEAAFFGVNKSVQETSALLDPIAKQLNSTYQSGATVYTTTFNYSSIIDWWSVNNDNDGSSTPIGVDLYIVSRLLDKPALTQSNFSQLLQGFGPTGASFFLVSGKAVHQQSSDFSAVNPKWRNSYVHAVSGVAWAFGNETLQAINEPILAHSQETFHEMAPNSGAYLNEAFTYEPDFQQSFWGSNYARLLSIKKQLDPNNVFWCKSCVGSEGIDIVNGQLCYL